MKAVQMVNYGGPEVLELNSVEKKKAKSNQILVKVKASGINPLEAYFRMGNPFYPKVPLPYILGSDFAGVVEEIGADVKDTRFTVGSRVFGLIRSGAGTYAEYTVVDLENDIMEILPDNASFSAGAAIGIPYLTAYGAMFNKGNMKKGECVLIHGGSGGVGLCAITIATVAGCNVIATAGSEIGKKNCLAAGAKYVVNHRVEDYAKEIIAKAEEFNGVDLILDTLGNAYLNQDMEVIKQGGRVVVCGCKDRLDFKLHTLMVKEVMLTGFRQKLVAHSQVQEIFADIKEKLAAKIYDPITVEFTANQAAEAHTEMENPSKGGSQGKLVLLF